MYPSDAEIEAAAQVLDREGRFHHWWPDHLRYDTLDPIAKDEFEAIVERILMAAASAKAALKTSFRLDQQSKELR